jgi:hypothetical protein
MSYRLSCGIVRQFCLGLSFQFRIVQRVQYAASCRRSAGKSLGQPSKRSKRRDTRNAENSQQKIASIHEPILPDVVRYSQPF